MQKISAVAALLIACVGVFFAILNDQNSSNKTTSSKVSVNKPLKKDQFVPTNAKNVFEGVKDEGLFLSKDKIPYHGRSLSVSRFVSLGERRRWLIDRDESSEPAACFLYL